MPYWSVSLVSILLAAGAPALAGGPAPAGPPPAENRALAYAELVAQGRKAREVDPKAAASAFEQALAISDVDGYVHLQLGEALAASKAYGAAVTELQRARHLGFGEPAPTDLKIAANLLAAGDRDGALVWIGNALDDRLKDRSSLASDARFAALRSDPRFARLAWTDDVPEDRVTGWRSDLELLAREIQRLYPPYHDGLPAPFRSRLEALERDLPRLSDQEVVLDAMALLASLRSAHTVVAPFGMKRGTLFRLPLHLYDFSDGVFVVEAPPELHDLVGARVVRLGGRSVQELMSAVAPYLSVDNDAFLAFASPFALTLPDLLRRVGASVGSAAVDVELERDGRAATVRVPIPQEALDPDRLPLKLSPPPAVEPPMWLRHPDDPFWMERLSPSTVYLDINQCIDGENESMAQLAERLNRELRVAGTRALVVDVRRNNGGNEDLMRPVIAAMLRFHSETAGARVFVMIGRNTLSAAQNFISTVDQWMDVTFVGEPSGSKPDHIGDDTFFVLPYSGLMGSIACAIHQTGFRDLREWIAPDLPVQLSSDDYFAGRDPALTAILRLADPAH